MTDTIESLRDAYVAAHRAYRAGAVAAAYRVAEAAWDEYQTALKEVRMTDITLDDLADRDRTIVKLTIVKLREQLSSSELQRAEIFDACQAHAKEGSVLREQLRRLTLYAEAHTNFPGADDLCDHGAESGCCSACSQRGSVKP